MKNTMVKLVDEIKHVDYSHILADQETLTIEKLLKHEPVKHILGPKGEYEICTTIEADHKTWRTVCQVCHHGEEVKKFPSKSIDHTHQIKDLKEISEALQVEFIQEAASIHHAYCNAVKDHIADLPQRSSSLIDQKMVVLLIVSILLLALAGYWFVFSNRESFPFKPDAVKPQILDKKSSPSNPGTIKPPTFSYQCQSAEPCNFALPLEDHGAKTSELVQADNLPSWLTFDRKLLCINGNVPPNEPTQTHTFLIRIKNQGENVRRLRVKLKIERNSLPRRRPPEANTSGGKSLDPAKIDQSYLLKKLSNNHEN
jgi:hypothetical protein